MNSQWYGEGDGSSDPGGGGTSASNSPWERQVLAQLGNHDRAPAILAGISGALKVFSQLNISGDANAKKEEEDEEEDKYDYGDLFQPPPPREDCAVCFLPLPNDSEKSTYKACCGQKMCLGCMCEQGFAVGEQNEKRMTKMKANPGLKLALIEDCCAFCKSPEHKNDKEGLALYLQRMTKRMELDDAEAHYVMYADYLNGIHGMPKDIHKAYEHVAKAAELGSADGYWKLATMYCELAEERGVKVDKAKEMHYLKLATKKGHVAARHNLGVCEYQEGKEDLAFKHWMISAALGDDLSLKNIGLGFRHGQVTKDEYASVLRAHKEYQDAEKSEERDLAYHASQFKSNLGLLSK